MSKWKGTLTREQALKIIDRATCHDDPHWENCVQDFYDERTDSMPSIFDVMSAIGVSEEEYNAVLDGDL